jgi:hypothetical protein
MGNSEPHATHGLDGLDKLGLGLGLGLGPGGLGLGLGLVLPCKSAEKWRANAFGK